MNVSFTMEQSTKTFLKIAFVTLAFFAIVLKMDNTNLSLQQRMGQQDAVLATNVEELSDLKHSVHKALEEKKSLEEKVVGLETMLYLSEQDRLRMTIQLREKNAQLEKALVPEATWSEAGQKRVVEPTVQTAERVTTYVKSLF